MKIVSTRLSLVVSYAFIHAMSIISIAAYAAPAQDVPRIQLAILLDTSNSMDGLIDQARNQLWMAVNEFAKAKKNGVTPDLEVAVFEYGNDRLSAQEGYTRKVLGLSRDLDKVSEALFALTTNGGAEFCGYVIQKAVQSLQWSSSPQDIKAIFIAGNEPFNQGPVAYAGAIAKAKAKGVRVNTIHAGDHAQGLASGWQDGALLAGGRYMSIDSDHKIVHIVTPQDKKIAELNTLLNKTYIPFGADGEKGIQRQQEQDKKNSDISMGLLAKRVQSKSSKLYNSADWDLVDALEKGDLDLNKIDAKQLPQEMRAMNSKDRDAFVLAKKSERELFKRQIEELSKERDEYISRHKAQEAKSKAPTLNDALTTAVREQALAQEYQFK